MKKYILLFALLLHAPHIFAQGEFVIELDPATGTFIKKSASLGYGFVAPNVRAYDEVNGRMIFEFGDPSPDHLLSIDVVTGAVVSNPAFPTVVIPDDVNEPQFDNTNQILYGLYHSGSSYFLATIDPATGVHTAIGTTPVAGINGLNQGMDAFDEAGQKYIVLSSGSIISIDVSSGNTATNASLSLQPGTFLINVSFNNANDTLYGLMMNNNSQLYFLVWIDPATGAVTEIGNGTALGAGNGSSAIDEANHRYIYHYSSQGIFYVAVMDLDDGDIIFHNQIALDNQDNVNSLKYDNNLQKLFAIHWDAFIDTTLGVLGTHTILPLVYPNPASDEISVRLGKNYKDLDVALCNALGQEVRTYHFEQASECDFQLNNLAPGVYFLKFETPDEAFSARFTRK